MNNNNTLVFVFAAADANNGIFDDDDDDDSVLLLNDDDVNAKEEDEQIARILEENESEEEKRHENGNKTMMTKERFRELLESYSETSGKNNNKTKGINAIDIAVYLVEKKLVKSVEEGLLLVKEEDVVTASLLRVRTRRRGGRMSSPRTSGRKRSF